MVVQSRKLSKGVVEGIHACELNGVWFGRLERSTHTRNSPLLKGSLGTRMETLFVIADCRILDLTCRSQVVKLKTQGQDMLAYVSTR